MLNKLPCYDAANLSKQEVPLLYRFSPFSDYLTSKAIGHLDHCR